MKDFLRRLLQGRYVGLLESELLRLRAENRALMNSLLGTAGFPPVDFPEAGKPGSAGGPQALPRLRKRSWHQIQAWRETGAVREAREDFEAAANERANGLVSHN